MRRVEGSRPVGEFALDETLLVGEDGVDGLDDGGARPPRLVELADLVEPRVALVLEDRDVAVAPAVDGLLRVADDEDGLLAVGLLGLVNEVRERLPLLAARVLELVQGPGADVRIGAVFEGEAAVVGQGGDEARHVREDEVAARADARLVEFLERIEKPPVALGEAELRAERTGEDVAESLPHNPRLVAGELERLSVECESVVVAVEISVDFLQEGACNPFGVRKTPREGSHPMRDIAPRRAGGGGGEGRFDERGVALEAFAAFARRDEEIDILPEDGSRIAPRARIAIRGERRVPRGDDVLVALDERLRVLVVLREAEGVVERGAVGEPRPMQERGGDLRLREPFGIRAHDFDLAEETQLQREDAQDAHEEAVERPDLREVLRGDDVPQRGGLVRVGRGAMREARHESREDLAGGRAREGERDDLLRLDALFEQGDEILDELVRLARPGRGFNEQVHRASFPDRESTLPTPSPPARGEATSRNRASTDPSSPAARRGRARCVGWRP